jgi:hypothetical protein
MERRNLCGACVSRVEAVLCVAASVCVSSCRCQGIEGAPAQASSRAAATSSGPAASKEAEVARSGCVELPEGSVTRPTPPVMGVSFEPDGATIRVTESGRLVFYAATSLEERRSLRFPAGSRFVDHGDTFLVGEDRRYWIGHVASGTFSDPIEATSAGQIQMSPSGAWLAVRHESDDNLELSVYEVKTRRWRRISAAAPALGPMNFCGLSERQASWCPVHAPGTLFQDLVSGALTAPERSSVPVTAWSAVLLRGTARDGGRSRTAELGKSEIQIVGPGPARRVDDAGNGPASMVLTCQAANRALVLRDTTRQIEMRTLPDWRPLRVWSGAAELAACSADGKRVAWVTSCDGQSMLVSARVP